METWVQSSIHALLAALALPKIGLPAIFLISLLSATLLPLGSEPAVFAYVQVAPHMYWAAILVATIGNTAGGAITYAMGAGAERAYEAWRKKHPAHAARPAMPGGRWHEVTTRCFRRFGPPALLASWLPGIGDPMCAVAGWLKLPFWPCVAYMAIGKCLRYVAITVALTHAWPWIEHWLL
jgi:membrane protein YqaA with SNARE-associated domain